MFSVLGVDLKQIKTLMVVLVDIVLEQLIAQAEQHLRSLLAAVAVLELRTMVLVEDIQVSSLMLGMEIV
tara:strand:- start:445 stop:651 length:207 start_codon:yes stop_codon:yes gene_type:complete